MKPFRFEDAKNKVPKQYCYRNGTKIKEVVVLESANVFCNVVSIGEDGGAIFHQSNGSIMFPQESAYDVMVDE